MARNIRIFLIEMDSTYCERSGLRKSVGEFISMRKVARELALDTRCVMDELEGG